MTDILFGQSYFPRFDPKLYAARQPYPPLGTLYAPAMCVSAATASRCSTPCWPNTDEWAAKLHQVKPHYAILFEDNFNYLSKMRLLRMREAAFEMIDAAKARGCTVICCGADMTDHADSIWRAARITCCSAKAKKRWPNWWIIWQQNRDSAVANPEDRLPRR